jgi:hypothetical protein
VLQLGSHCLFCGYADGVLRLHLPDEDAHLRNDSLVRQLAAAASQRLGTTVQLRFEPKPAQAGDTLHKRNERQRSRAAERRRSQLPRRPGGRAVARPGRQHRSRFDPTLRPPSEN